MISRRGLGVLVFVVLSVVALAAAATAQASSIFFIRSGDIWVANPDGSGAKQVTTDGSNGMPYIWVAAAKGTSTRLAYLRDNEAATPRQQYGTMNPDGTGSAVNPGNASMQSGATTDGQMVSIDGAGDRIAWPQGVESCFGACHTDYTAYSIGTDGSNALHTSSSTSATNVTFGDPSGQTLLWNDFPDWSVLPAPCSGTTRYALLLQAPAATYPTPGTPSVYCVQNLDLIGPALRPDGQMIAAVEEDVATAGTARIVTIPMGGVATSSAVSPVTPVTSPGTASSPDFSPDGTQIAFEGAGSTIDTVSAGGGAVTQILTNATSPAWSPYSLPGSGSGGGGGGGGGTGTGTGHTAHCKVPKLKGDTVAQAQKALKHAGCKLGKKKSAFSSKVKRGRVISQSPAAGKTVSKGTAVAITLSKGKHH